MTSESEIRKRNTGQAVAGSQSNEKASPGARSSTAPSSSFSLVDALRAVFAVVLISTLGSYLTTRGESWIWGYERPWWTQPKMISAAMQSPLLLTNEELAAYDGSDSSKPILLGLNRTIYDVSASPAVYGPGGMYSSLAAKDASRSYITTCFDPKEDLVPYLGGVEEIYVPIWLSTKPAKEELDEIAQGEVMEGMGMKGLIDGIQKKVGRKRSRLMKEEAYEKGRERVRAQIQQWESMFEKKKYPKVGRVVGVDENDESKWKHLGFCEAARKQRPPPAESLGEAMKALGEKTGNINIGKMKKSSPGGGVREGIKKKPKKDAEEKEPETEDEKAKAKIDDMLGSGNHGEDGRTEKAARAETE
ncbi:MAG: hypothetical protein M1828_001625 [Chrysothrix sp. TS-e1954]|nr:MAG: hypothetical protein M1828_001625 [Chrysothrix sp. TS-e1954]